MNLRQNEIENLFFKFTLKKLKDLKNCKNPETNIEESNKTALNMINFLLGDDDTKTVDIIEAAIKYDLELKKSNHKLLIYVQIFTKQRKTSSLFLMDMHNNVP